jgi:hypothetical protein
MSGYDEAADYSFGGGSGEAVRLDDYNYDQGYRDYR